ncbi:MAG: hypothetical protein AAF682_26285 [Planctomycetota bacterium]
MSSTDRADLLQRVLERAVAEAVEELPEEQRDAVLADLREGGEADSATLAALLDLEAAELAEVRAQARARVLERVQPLFAAADWNELLRVLRARPAGGRSAIPAPQPPRARRGTAVTLLTTAAAAGLLLLTWPWAARGGVEPPLVSAPAPPPVERGATVEDEVRIHWPEDGGLVSDLGLDVWIPSRLHDRRFTVTVIGEAGTTLLEHSARVVEPRHDARLHVTEELQADLDSLPSGESLLLTIQWFEGGRWHSVDSEFELR